MTQKSHFKLVDKYQFNEQKFTTVDGIDEFEAIHVDTRQGYTLKRMCLNSGADRQQSARILQELSILKKLSHPLVPKCHKLLKTSNNMYLIYDPITGASLRSYLGALAQPNSKNKVKQALQMGEQLCEVLAFLADRHICHSSITPAHIFVDAEALTKIINFSYAVEITLSEGAEVDTKNRVFDDYCAPQVKEGRMTLKSDVYSIGVILQEMFSILKEMAGSTCNPQEEVSIDNVLSFCRNKMKNPQISLRATAKEAYIYFKQRQFEDPPEKREVITSRRELLLTDPGIRMPRLEDNKMVKQRSHSPYMSQKMKRTQTEVGGQSQEYLYIARKVLQRRNLSLLMLELSDFCSSTLLCSSQRSLPLCFLLLKKSTSIVSQLAKFLQTGRGDGLKMQQKIKEKLKKQRLFTNLQRIIYTEMKLLQEKLISTAQLIKETIKLEGKQLSRELQVQKVDNNYLKKCIGEFQQQLNYWDLLEDNKGDRIVTFGNLLTKKQMVMLYVLALLIDFGTIEEFFDELFSESGCSLWKESFLVEMMNLQVQQIYALIQQQRASINSSHRLEDISISSSHSISISQRRI